MKTIWKNKASRAWLIVASVSLALVMTVNILVSTRFYRAVCVLLGEPPVVVIGEEKSNYEKDFATKADALANGDRVGDEICREGFVLLKNDDGTLPLKAGETKVSVFGKNSVDIAIGGSGSGGSVGRDAVSIFDSLTASGFAYNRTLVNFYQDKAKSGVGRNPNNSDLDTGGAVELAESFVGETPIGNYNTPIDGYNDVWASCAGYTDAALIVLTRIGGEGADLPRVADDHILKLRPAEKDLINEVKTRGIFGKIILVLNTAAALEMKEINADDGIGAVLWIGYAGGSGMSAFGEILKGETTDGVRFGPSGKTVDTWAADFTHSPVWANMGAALGGDAYLLTGGKSGEVAQNAYFVDYEEGIYVGYRFYETAYAEQRKGNAAMGGYVFDYAEEVVYPFGFGLSYTSFIWELMNGSEVRDKVLTADTSLTFKVKVTNAGGYPGRDVVQLYVTPPYDGTARIEKPAKLLVGFAKTGILDKGESETVEITVDSPYEFASYDYRDANGDGFKGYEAEQGAYTFAISADAHNPVIDVDTSVANGIQYGKDPVTGAAVVNQYTDREDGMNSDKELGGVLSRADWSGTWPAPRASAEKKLDGRLDWLASVIDAKSTPNRPDQNDQMPATGANNGLRLSDLAGLDYNDGRWDKFLDQLKVSEMGDLVNNGAFKTVAIERLGVPQTIAADGPVGFCNFISSASVYETCAYPCQAVIASTWNVGRLYDMGRALGNEALVGDIKNGGTPYTGWYAPGLNIHRSPFGGRNFEYYSEDAFLSGKLAAAVVKGAASKGVYADLKHFALNDQETHRNGLLTWAAEQPIREVYLKAFEIAIKTAKADGVKAMGVMSSFNRIGERWTGGDYRLLTTILRHEWGFEGLVINDFNTNSYMFVKDMVYAGGDLNLEMAGFMTYKPNARDKSDVTVFRQACKNILYTVANSNAMRGKFKMGTPTWQVIMFATDAVLAAGFAAWGFFAIRKAYKKQKA
ncbi:MAG: glycoside hydrolase family 3 C-terminal domain-containing protein [Clostridiales bacterium]|jgi:beta-glucosidase|nr:glycoside hydrolase family 3 C-terminal domain-containing protein [Clostridiales bacterium]